MELPDPITEQWLAEVVPGLSDAALSELVSTLRARGGREAELADAALRRREESRTVIDSPGQRTVVSTPGGRRDASEGGGTAPGWTAELAPGSRFANYVIEGVAGRGGMGVVYRASQIRPHRTVALKVISPALANDPNFRERFAGESEIAASIEHSNVVPVYEVGEEAQLLFIVMRYVEGTDLGAVISSQGRLEPHRAVEILSQLTAALDAAHERGLVHRDVKPANVLIAHEGGREHVYLTDFGLAKLATRGGATRTGMFVGTLDYAAPEQIEGKRVDARTDVYAAGCVLFHMLTGVVPFQRDNEAAIMMAHLAAPTPSARALVPSLPPDLDDVISRATAKDPRERFPSAGDLGRAATAALEGQSATLLERSVGTGRAAPVSTPGPPTDKGAGAGRGGSDGATAEPGRRGRGFARLPAALGSAALVAVVAVVLVVSGVFGGGKHHAATAAQRSATTTSSGTSSTTSSATTLAAPTTRTYRNPSQGISFAYPASWEPLTLSGTVADFGIHPGAGETRCALVLENNVGPNDPSQEAQLAFVRARSAQGAAAAKHYEVRAIQAEQGMNVSGVGLVRVADAQGGHLAFFFRGTGVFIFDCITPARQLDQVDRQDFQPLIASVRIT